MMVRPDPTYPPFVESPPRTVVAHGSAVSGRLIYDLPVKIDGSFHGELKARELLVIGSNAEVEGEISADNLKVEGRLLGKVHVTGWLEILPGGRLKGEIRVGRLKIHPGGMFEGEGKIASSQHSALSAKKRI
ncbi:MAG: polymer-forming cytoskeletal protein [Deltaproteobacteria bacterium]|nr:polymer-forming cytoskeletal protein [Deltaproteobacteria bacterium]